MGIGYFIAWVVVLIIAVTIMSNQPKVEPPTPSSLEDFSFPTAEEGRAITVIFGSRIVTGANVVWYGDLRSEKIIKRVRSGFSKKKQTMGYKYYMGIHFVLCTGEIDRVSHIRVGEKTLWGTLGEFDTDGNVTNGDYTDGLDAQRAEAQALVDAGIDYGSGTNSGTFNFGNVFAIMEAMAFLADNPSPTEFDYFGIGEGSMNIDKENLFGGKEKEGGISGTLSFHYGAKTQETPPYLAAHLPSDRVHPAYRGVTSAVLHQMYIGTQAYPKPWAFFISRSKTQSSGKENWYIEKAVINTFDSNPIHTIRECLVDTTWGIGMPEGAISDASFRAAADTLYTEGMGLSFIINQEGKMEEFISDVLYHISGAMLQNRHTGLIEIVLLRDDYDTATLPHYGTNEIRQVKNYAKPLVSELINTVVVTFWDRTLYKVSSYRVHDPAAVAVQGGVIEQTFELKGCTNRELASKIATRMLVEGSTPITSMEITIDRTGISHNIGDVIRVTWDQFGVVDTPFRIIGIVEPDFGKGGIILTLIQDIFSYHEAIYTLPSDANWSRDDKPLPLEYSEAFELSYGLALESYTQAELVDGSFNGVGIVSTVGSTSQDNVTGYFAYSTDDENGTQISALTNLATMAKLSDDLQPADTTMTVSLIANTVAGGVADFQHIGFAMIGEELIEITAWNSLTGLCVVKRGVYDTQPSHHAINASVYLIEIGEMEVFDLPFIEGAAAGFSFVTAYPDGDLPFSQAPTRALGIYGRVYRPYPPRAVKFDGVYFDDVIVPADLQNPDVTITWTPADKLAISNNPLNWFTDTGVAPAGMTYNIYFYNDDTNDLLESSLGLSVLTYTAAPAYQRIRVELESELDGVKSVPFKHVFIFPYFATEAIQFSVGDLNMVVEGPADYRTTVSTDSADFDPAFSTSALVGETLTPQGRIASVPFAGYSWRNGTIWYQFRGQAGASTTLLPAKMALNSEADVPMLGFGINNGFMQIEIFNNSGSSSTLFTSTTALGNQVYFTYKVDTFFKSVTFYADEVELDTVSWDSLNLASMALTNTAIKGLVISDGVAGEFDHKISQILATTDGDGILGWRVKTVEITGNGTDTDWSGSYADVSGAVYNGATMISVKSAGADETVAIEDITDTRYTVEQVTLSTVATAPTGALVNSLVPIMERGGTTTELGSTISVLNRSEYQPISYIMAVDPATSVKWTYADLANTDFGVRSK